MLQERMTNKQTKKQTKKQQQKTLPKIFMAGGGEGWFSKIDRRKKKAPPLRE